MLALTAVATLFVIVGCTVSAPVPERASDPDPVEPNAVQDEVDEPVSEPDATPRDEEAANPNAPGEVSPVRPVIFGDNGSVFAIPPTTGIGNKIGESDGPDGLFDNTASQDLSSEAFFAIGHRVEGEGQALQPYLARIDVVTGAQSVVVNFGMQPVGSEEDLNPRYELAGVAAGEVLVKELRPDIASGSTAVQLLRFDEADGELIGQFALTDERPGEDCPNVFDFIDEVAPGLLVGSLDDYPAIVDLEAATVDALFPCAGGRPTLGEFVDRADLPTMVLMSDTEASYASDDVAWIADVLLEPASSMIYLNDQLWWPVSRLQPLSNAPAFATGFVQYDLSSRAVEKLWPVRAYDICAAEASLPSPAYYGDCGLGGVTRATSIDGSLIISLGRPNGQPVLLDPLTGEAQPIDVGGDFAYFRLSRTARGYALFERPTDPGQDQRLFIGRIDVETATVTDHVEIDIG